MKKLFSLGLISMVSLFNVAFAAAQTTIKTPLTTTIPLKTTTTTTTLSAPTAPKLDVPITAPTVQTPIAPTPTLNAPGSTSTTIGVTNQGPTYSGSTPPVTQQTIVNQLLNSGTPLPQQNSSYFGGAVDGAVSGATPDAPQSGAVQGAIVGATPDAPQGSSSPTGGEQGGQSGSSNPIEARIITPQNQSGEVKIFNTISDLVFAIGSAVSLNGGSTQDRYDSVQSTKSFFEDVLKNGGSIDQLTVTIRKEPTGVFTNVGSGLKYDQDASNILPILTESEKADIRNQLNQLGTKPGVYDPAYLKGDQTEYTTNRVLGEEELREFYQKTGTGGYVSDRECQAGACYGREALPAVSSPRPAPVEACVGPECNQ